MKLPKFLFKIILFCFLLVVTPRCFSQKDSASKFLRVSLDAAMILNKTFSHFEEPSTSNHHSTAEYSEFKNSPAYLPGISFGLTGRMGATERCVFVFGLSASITQARYHFYDYSYQEGQGYTGKSWTTELDINKSSVYLNYEIGCRFRIFKKLFFQQTFIINQNAQTIQKENGIKTSREFSYYITPEGGWFPFYDNKTDEYIHSTRYFPDKTYVSTRLSAFYEFKIRNKTTLLLFSETLC